MAPKSYNKSFFLHKVLVTVNELLNDRARSKMLRLTVSENYPTDLCIEGDDHQLFFALMNLIDDAIKNTSNSTISLQINQLAESSGKVALEFSVHNPACSFDIDQKPSPITDKMIKGIGGHFKVVNVPGYGSIFSLKLLTQKASILPVHQHS